MATASEFGRRPGENDSLDTTVPVDDYLATLAEDWLGVPAAEVLTDAQPLGLSF